MPDQYATRPQFLNRYDVRIVGRLVNDDGTTTDRATLETGNTILDEMIQDASAEVKASAHAGHTYSTDDLSDLNTAQDPLLIRLVSTLAMRNLYLRRSDGVPDDFRETVDAAEDMLGDIRRGRRVFDLASIRDASEPSTYRPTIQESATQWPVTNSPLYPNSNRRETL